MLWRALIPALAGAALLPGLALAQSPPVSSPSQRPGQMPDIYQAEDLPRQIHEKLTEQGFQDVKIVPGSYLVSAKDKNGTPVIMVIGPDSATVITMAPQTGSPQEDESTAQSKDGGDKIIQQ